MKTNTVEENLQDAILDRPIFKPGWSTMFIQYPDDPELGILGLGRELPDGRVVFCSRDNHFMILAASGKRLFYKERISLREADEAIRATQVRVN